MDNLLSSLWELSRFHTRESWLAWFPAIWGLVFAIHHDSFTAIPAKTLVKLVVSNWLCMTLIHGTFCTWNDILDASIDAKVERTKYRPLPSKRISTTSAYLWFAVQLVTCSLLVYTSLGLHSFLVVLPAYALSAFYPLTKRFMQWPQLVLAPTVAWPVLVGWTSVRGPIALEAAAPLFACYAVWTIYYDTAYGFQDINDDLDAKVGSLAQSVGPQNIKSFMFMLGALTILLLGIAARSAMMGVVFWVLGVGVWAASLPFQVGMLDVRKGRENSGGAVFGFNIRLGVWITAVVLGELAVGKLESW